METNLQIALGLAPLTLMVLLLSIFSKKNRIRNIMLTVILLAAVGFVAVPAMMSFLGDTAKNTAEIDKLSLVYAIAYEGSPELAIDLLQELQVKYKPDYTLCAARLAASGGSFQTAKALYMKSVQFFPDAGREYDTILALFQAEKDYDLALRNDDQAQLENALAAWNNLAGEISDALPLIFRESIGADYYLYTKAALYIIFADEAHKAYLYDNPEGLHDGNESSKPFDATETGRQLRQINTFLQENPGFSTIPQVRLARLKLQILNEDYKSIAANVNEHSDYNELLIASELFLNNYVRQSYFIGEFSSENTAKYDLVYNNLNDIFNNHYHDKSRDERNAARGQLQALKTVIKNPALGRMSEELSRYAESEYALDASKAFLQMAKIEHSLGNDVLVSKHLDRSIDTVGDCEDVAFTRPMYEIIGIITDKDDAQRIRGAAVYVAQVLDNNMTVKVTDLFSSPLEAESGEESLIGDFALQMQTYVNQKRMAVNIVRVDTTEFERDNTVKATVNISNNLYTSANDLKQALTVRDCGINITDFTIEKVNYTKANILLCLDVSGSMSDNNKIGMLRDAVKLFAADVAAIENIALVTFDSRIVLQHPFGLSSEELLTIADSLRPLGGTNMYGALIGSIPQFENNPGEINSIILMSDGMDNNPRSVDDIITNIGEPSRGAKGITIYSIGFGDDADHEYLSRFAAATGGAYLFANEPNINTQLNQLGAFFDGLRAQILNQYIITFKAADTLSFNRELIVSVDSELNRDRVRYRLGGGTDSITDSLDDTDSPVFMDGKAVYGFRPTHLYKNGRTLETTLAGTGFTADDNISVAIRGRRSGLSIPLRSDFTDANSVSVAIPAGAAADIYDVVVTINGKSSIMHGGLTLATQGSVGNRISKELLASLSSIAYENRFYGIGERLLIISGGMDYWGWKIVHSYQENNNIHGLWYLVFEKDDDVIIAFRGTPAPGQNNSLNAPDWWDTIGSIITGRHRQAGVVETAIKEGGDIYKYLTGKKTIYITGYSLGGYLSMESFRQIAISRRAGWVNKIETFNPVGMGSDANTFMTSQLSIMTHNQTCCDLAKIASNIRGLNFPRGTLAGKSAGCRPCITPRRDASWWENVWSAYNMIGLVDITNPANMAGAWVDLAITMGAAHSLDNFDMYAISR